MASYGLLFYLPIRGDLFVSPSFIPPLIWYTCFEQEPLQFLFQYYIYNKWQNY